MMLPAAAAGFPQHDRVDAPPEYSKDFFQTQLSIQMAPQLLKACYLLPHFTFRQRVSEKYIGKE